MKKMSKRIMAVVLTLCIALSVFTAAAFALGEGSITSLKLTKTENGIVYSATVTTAKLAEYAAGYQYAGGKLSALRFICTLEDNLLASQLDSVSEADIDTMTGNSLFVLEDVYLNGKGVEAVYRLDSAVIADWSTMTPEEVEQELSRVTISITTSEVAATEHDFNTAANQYGKLVTTARLTIDSDGSEDFLATDLPITVAKAESISVYSSLGSGASSSVSKVEKDDEDEDDAPAESAVEAFDDIPTNAWYTEAVEYVYENGLMNGVGDSFAPASNTTRGQLMTILARIDGVDTNKGTAWFSAGLDWAVANGISDGTNHEANITREQLAAMLYRYAKMLGIDIEAEFDLSSFKDADKVSAYAVEAFKWACNAGIINGANNNLNPGYFATRAEVAAMLMRFNELIAK